ncbi:MAG: HEAT repeat domain-containing protein [Proteobacteria bacterium]|nr:HEAT repeat domain-containing protein [Pseudomonadota bacterium]
MSSASPDWLDALGSAELAERRRACDAAIDELRRRPELGRHLRRVLRGGSREASFAAAYVLFQAQGPSPGLLPALVESLDLPDADARWQALEMLVALGRRRPEVLEGLLRRFRAGEPALRRRMLLYALRDLEPADPTVEAALVEGLDDGDADVRRAAAVCLARLTRPDLGTLDRLLEIARGDPDARLRRIAAAVVPALLGPHPGRRPEAERLLRGLSSHPDPAIARAARAGLARLAPAGSSG